MAKRLWTRDELLVTFNLYFKIPFGKMYHGTPEVIRIAQLINRSPNAIAMRPGNFAHHDPYHIARGIKGLSGGARQCQPIWEEYFNNREDIMYESELVLQKYLNKTDTSKTMVLMPNSLGQEKDRVTKTRVNQNLFRQIILSSYAQNCAMQLNKRTFADCLNTVNFTHQALPQEV